MTLASMPRLTCTAITDEPCPNSPWFAVIPTRAPATCRSPAAPRNCQVSSQTWAMACAGTASPKEASPPLTFTGIRPPERRRALPQQLGRLALAAQPQILVPLQLQGRGQVVHLGEREILGADAGLLVRGPRDRRAEACRPRAPPPTAESVAMSGRSSTVLG